MPACVPAGRCRAHTCERLQSACKRLLTPRYALPRHEIDLNSILLHVSVPVLSEKMYLS